MRLRNTGESDSPRMALKRVSVASGSLFSFDGPVLEHYGYEEWMVGMRPIGEPESRMQP